MYKDLHAEIETMYIDADKTKGIYIGYSEGTIQMFVGLTKLKTDFNGWLSKAIFLAPCSIPNSL